MTPWEFVNPWGFVDPDTQTDVVVTLLSLLFYGVAVYRFAVKRERARAESHRCPPPTIQFVERPHDPWQPTPWVRVDQLNEDEVSN